MRYIGKSWNGAKQWIVTLGELIAGWGTGPEEWGNLGHLSSNCPETEELCVVEEIEDNRVVGYSVDAQDENGCWYVAVEPEHGRYFSAEDFIGWLPINGENAEE